MQLFSSGLWPIKIGLTLALYYNSESTPLLDVADPELWCLAAFFCLQMAIFLPSIVFAVPCRTETNNVMKQTVVYNTILVLMLWFENGSLNKLSVAALPFVMTHVFYHLHEEACKHRTFNNCKFVSWVAFAGGLVLGFCAAFSCRWWPAQLRLLPCLVAGEIMGFLTTVVCKLVNAIGDVYELFIQSI